MQQIPLPVRTYQDFTDPLTKLIALARSMATATGPVSLDLRESRFLSPLLIGGVLFPAVPGTAQELVLDFSDVEFVSRGFADELHKVRLRYQAEHKVAVVLENVNESVQQMLSAVARTPSGKSTLRVELPVIRVNNVEELERMLLGS